MASRLMDYLLRIGRWARIDLMPFWRPIAVVVLVLVLTLLLPLPGEQQLRFAGLVLQLAGLGTVAHGLNQTRAAFNLKKVTTAFWDALKAFPSWSKSVSLITGTAHLSLGGAKASLRGTMRIDPNATLEEKVQRLATQLENVSALAYENRERLEAESERLTHALAAEARDRSSGDEKNRDLLKKTLTGGLVLEATGLMWLIAGIVLATVPGEILCAVESLAS